MPLEATLERAIVPAPVVLTPKGLAACRDAAPAQVYAQYEQVVGLLAIAERDFFVPLLTETPPANFAQQFEFLAYKYAPIRLFALSLLKNVAGKQFMSEYFDVTLKLENSMIERSWGLPKTDLAVTVGQYLQTAQRLVISAPTLHNVSAKHVVQLLVPITEVDFGLTALAFVFEGSISATDWVVAETFTKTRRAILDYEDVAKKITDEAQIDSTLAHLRFETEIDQPGERDFRHNFLRYERP